jgi:hypothetical protein
VLLSAPGQLFCQSPLRPDYRRDPMSLNEEEIQQARYDLIELQIEHSDLDHAIQLMLQNPYTDQLRLRRMKKRKLKLKDNIQRLESMVIPDMDA